MKIVFTAGGTGGHFYPLIAVAEAIQDLVAEQRLITPRFYYLAPAPYDERVLFENGIEFIKTPAGKVRRYFSFLNFTDMFVTLAGTVSCFFILLKLYPDVIFSKGGYASVPTVLAARFLGIPVVIHESDAKPGRANLLAAKSAKRIAVSFDSTAQYFPAKVRGRIARTGIPIRKALLKPEVPGAAGSLGLDPSAPTILILGGSSGSKRINEMLLSGLPDIVSFANVIHQTGRDLYADVESTAHVILNGNANATRYHAYPYLNADALREAASASTVIVSRAGATAIAEIALWRRPAILIPIPESVSHDQRTNAYAFAHTGAAVVLEEENMTPHVLASEARRIASDPALASRMAESGAAFANPDAARVLAEELLSIAISHAPDEARAA